MLDTVLGLPVHALIVHGVVVVVPLVAVAAVAVAAYGPWRRRLALPLAALALGMTGLAWVATESGEALNERLGLPDVARRHTELEDTSRIKSCIAQRFRKITRARDSQIPSKSARRISPADEQKPGFETSDETT